VQLTISTFLILTAGTILGQTADTIPVIHKSEKYYLSKTCYDILYWDEVTHKDKVIEKVINQTIKNAAYSYKLSKDNAEDRCHNQMEYEQECKIVYAKHDLVSCNCSAYTYYKGAPHGWRDFQTLNFDAKSGKQISFHSLIDSTKIEAIDSLIILKFKKESNYQEEWKDQLPGIAFTINDKGISIIFNSTFGPTDLDLTFEELKPFINKSGLLKFIGSNTN